MSGADPLLAIARQLAREAELPDPVRLDRLPGGKNNRVFRVTLADGSDAVLKSYHVDARDNRDRLGAEWAFLKFAWARGVRTIPVPLAADHGAQTALYSFVAGRRLDEDEIGIAQVQAAVDFVIAINAAPRDPMGLAPGSEACFSLNDHLATVDRRVARLGTLEPSAPFVVDAGRFVRETLMPAWSAVRVRIVDGARCAGIDPGQAMSSADLCVSPSDFGFHNALVDDSGRVNFIDFEYAGRDDPAKLICDFFCQPEVPLPRKFCDLLREGTLAGLGVSQATHARCRLLLDAYRVKWICIMFNEFLPLGAARRAFSSPELWSERCGQQLQKARTKIAEIGIKGHE